MFGLPLDQLAIWISLLAFVLSLLATLSGERRASEERRRTLRVQLSDVLDRLSSLQLENARLSHEARGDTAYVQAVGAALAQQNGFLLDQASFLAGEIPSQVTAYEFNTLAAASFAAGNMIDAEKYHQRAIGAARLPLYQAQATRGYAVFLFSQRRFDEARAQFAAALALAGDGDNLARQTNGLTYQTWAWHERYVAMDESRAGELLDRARAAYGAIDIEFVRVSMLQALDLATTPGPPAPVAAPGVDASLAKR